MEDQDVLDHINALSSEEERLYSQASHEGGLTDAERRRLGEIKVRLDQYYDLLHQRQAKRAAGQDPGEAELREPDVVEGYEQ